MGKPLEIADLHIHSKESAEVQNMSGGKRPEEILDDIAGPREFTRQTYQGEEVRVKAVAFTEHDVICNRSRLKRIIEYGRKKDILVIPAIELDCTHDYLDQIHINCMFFFNSLNAALENDEFKNLIEITKSGRRESYQFTVSELIGHGHVNPAVQDMLVEDMPSLFSILSNPDYCTLHSEFCNVTEMKKWLKKERYFRTRTKPKAEDIARLARKIGFIFSIEHSRKIEDKRKTAQDRYITERDRVQLIKDLAPRALQVFYPYDADQEFCRAKGIDKDVVRRWEESENKRIMNSSGELTVPIGGSDFHSVYGTRNPRRVAECFTFMHDLEQLIDIYTKLK
ncbi:hypothetical protein GF371_00135 [Candidatus Woesearchaeota archaeon]|nr:hypothetical protein [Candidatus Woesearchaeota archaeon]